jgi:tryptophan-rich sensory protein
MISRFYRLDRSAAIMNIPYLAWVSFATTLNAAYALLN